MQPSPQIAATAVDLLLKLIGGERFLAPALLHHTLRHGDSTASPPAHLPSHVLSTAPARAGVPAV